MQVYGRETDKRDRGRDRDSPPLFGLVKKKKNCRDL